MGELGLILIDMTSFITSGYGGKKNKKGAGVWCHGGIG